ncbi:MAG TPA: hypothetical protein VH328_03580 [Burkholderiaceae bacterium]|jgi:hypothetical protein|nr:hypothetical protein [Burkholderiaceae bacterium]
MTTALRRSAIVAASTLAGLLVLFVGVMGFAHTRAGRPLLAVIGRVVHGGSCPLGFDKTATPAAREQAAARFSASHRGVGPAHARPALGFALGESRRSDVVAALAARGVSCTKGGAAELVCPHVPAKDLPGTPERELWFTFGAHQQLLSLVALSRDSDPRVVSAAFAATTTAVSQQAGPATKTSGDGSATSLAAGALSQASAEFRFSDYYALARATNMGTGYLLTEEYRALID